ncbi:GntR family transcriptional regulator / MocR family aminotransferase [Rhizobium sp. NFR07]|uniref:aminotransferase-like domain-containing protein n=1 Tax=Rhizobium sp. NFR07 TaxID=1566262 RepID=UPI0008E90FEE|nr:PLP-dependent aminotransferase family protein [Rhizobium sp. NFR07]SFB43585.1 GntR family transcriptional regulator / MocR family aminotransferase [Rhizobium sp. NFR07]
MQFQLDRDASLPLAEQIARSIETRILSGAYKPGQRLPSTRQLSQELGVSRSTVSDAFDMLMAEGLIIGVTGSGTFVNSVRYLEQRRALPGRVTPIAELPAAPRAVVNALAWGPTLDYFPFDVWQRIGTEQAARMRELMSEGDPAGFAPLREQIAAYLKRRRALVCHPDQIIVTSGMTQGLDLVARTLLRTGDVALMEDPAELRIRTTLTLAGANVVPLPVDGEGLRIDTAPERFRLVHLSPVRQFPSGSMLSDARERDIQQRAEANDAYVVEMDNTALLPEPRPPIFADEASRDRTIYLSTWSWTMFRSLRIGYIVAQPAMIDRLVATRAAMDFRPPLIEQYMLEQFMREGHLDRYIDRMRAVLAVRRQSLVGSWPDDMPAAVQLSPEPGGLGHMLMLPDGMDVERLLRQSAARGLEPRNISPWYADPQRRALLLGFAYAGEFTTIKGMRDLADILRS